MPQVLPLQTGQIENLDKLALFVDAIQNPKRYQEQIDTGLKMLTKLKEVIDQVSTVDNAQLYLEAAKKEHAQAQKTFSQLKAELLTTLELREKELEDRTIQLRNRTDELSKQDQDLSKVRSELSRKEHELMVADQHLLNKAEQLKAKEAALVVREQELKQKSEMLKGIIGVK